MSLKPLFAAALALGVLASGQAEARSSHTCTLEAVSPSGTNPVHVGQQFGFTVQVIQWPTFGPHPPISYKPYEVIFHGTRNGVMDTGSGQHLMNAPLNFPETTLATNPGGIAGNYLRYALIYKDGQFICSTNTVSIGLL
jgi:hypothetical protein